MNQREEAEKVYRNLKADHRQIAHYVVERCGDFIYDHEREDFIAEFLRAAVTTSPLKQIQDAMVEAFYDPDPTDPTPEVNYDSVDWVGVIRDARRQIDLLKERLK